MRRRNQVLAALLTVGGVSYATNASWLAQAPASPARLLAHRGVHQTFDLEGVDDDTCTATRIHPITHPYLENTLPSMRAAFDAGASAVELDLHATSDHRLAVFHDAGLACRTDGDGAPEDHTLDELRRLDLGYGYTNDGGRTFPLRGTGVGLMLSLDDVLAAFPDRALILHLKTNRVEDGDLVADTLAALGPDRRAKLLVYGGSDAVARVTGRLPDVRGFDGRRLKRCLGGYLLYGWTGIVPAACDETAVLVPVSHAHWLWGWPRRFEARMDRVGTEVFLIGPWEWGEGHTRGIDDPQTLAKVPEDFGGWIWTNRVKDVAP